MAHGAWGMSQWFICPATRWLPWNSALSWSAKLPRARINAEAEAEVGLVISVVALADELASAERDPGSSPSHPWFQLRSSRGTSPERPADHGLPVAVPPLLTVQ